MEEEIIISERPIPERRLAAYPQAPLYGHFEPTIITLQEWLCCSFSDFFKDDIQQYRAERNEADKSALYSRLPVATIAGFSYMENGVLLPPVCYNGLLDFDIRREDNEGWDFQTLKAALRDVPYIAYVGDDTNGEDLFCIVAIRWPNRYAQHFGALRNDLLNADIIISGNDNPAHFRKVSLDPNGFINGNAQQFSKLFDYL